MCYRVNVDDRTNGRCFLAKKKNHGNWGPEKYCGSRKCEEKKVTTPIRSFINIKQRECVRNTVVNSNHLFAIEFSLDRDGEEIS